MQIAGVGTSVRRFCRRASRNSAARVNIEAADVRLLANRGGVPMFNECPILIMD